MCQNIQQYVGLCAIVCWNIYSEEKDLCFPKKEMLWQKNISLNNSDYGLSLLSLGKLCLVEIKVREENIIKSEKHSILEDFRNILKYKYCSDLVDFTCFTGPSFP